jgi:uncharacterized membrane protein YedE/YeeE
MIELLSKPWPWYIAGPLIGLTVPTLLILGNKAFGISSSLRHICAICVPTKIPFFQYDWKSEIWNLFFVAGIFLGAIIATLLLDDPNPIVVHPALSQELKTYGIENYQSIIPLDLFNWESLLTIKGFFLIVVGGFMVGFGTRYGEGCTSGHAIMGLSTLQWPSLVATISFMIGGLLMANFGLPFLLSL